MGIEKPVDVSNKILPVRVFLKFADPILAVCGICGAHQKTNGTLDNGSD
jgi:hypothetical protein